MSFYRAWVHFFSADVAGMFCAVGFFYVDGDVLLEHGLGTNFALIFEVSFCEIGIDEGLF